MRFGANSGAGGLPGGPAGGQLGGTYPNPIIVGDVFSSPTDATTRVRYVTSTGSDTTGDGLTQATAWRTVAFAIMQAPDLWVSTPTTVTTMVYQIRVIPPYTGILGTMTLKPFAVRGPTTQVQSIIQVIAWPSNDVFGGVADPRWSVLAGPLAVTAASQYSVNRLLYTLPALTLSTNDQHVGEFVRIFNAGGTEVCRGWIFRSVAGATQQIYVHTRQTYTAVNTDVVYIVRPTVILGLPTTSTISGTNNDGSGGQARMLLEFNCVRTIDAINVLGAVTITGTNSQFVANGGAGAFSTVGALAWVSGSTTTTFVAGVPTAEDTLRQNPCFFRSVGGTGFLGSGNFTLSSCVWLGQYRPLNLSGPIATLQLGLNCTFRGDISTDNNPVYIYGFALTNFQILFIPTSVVPQIQLNTGSQLIFDSTGFVALETALSAGDFIRGRNGSRAYLLSTLRPVTPATPMAAGIILSLTSYAQGIINTASTLAGAGGVDVKSGANAAVTLAALAGATPNTDAVNLTTIAAGATI